MFNIEKTDVDIGVVYHHLSSLEYVGAGSGLNWTNNWMKEK